jgi:hypothetical protein
MDEVCHQPNSISCDPDSVISPLSDHEHEAQPSQMQLGYNNGASDTGLGRPIRDTNVGGDPELRFFIKANNHAQVEPSSDSKLSRLSISVDRSSMARGRTCVHIPSYIKLEALREHVPSAIVSHTRSSPLSLSPSLSCSPVAVSG